MEQRYIGTAKGHEHRFTVSAVLDVNTLPRRDYNRPAAEQQGWIEYCGTAAWIGPCPTCCRVVSLIGHAIHGKHSESRKCDARCTSAKGFNCECQCAGKNHGADYSL